MNKADLIERISSAAGINKAQASRAVEAIISSATSTLKKGERVALVGFGTFNVAQRKARNVRNPQTGAVVRIPARRVAKFTPGVDLKKAVNRK